MRKAEEDKRKFELEAGIKQTERERRQAERESRDANDALIVAERARLRQIEVDSEKLDREIKQLQRRGRDADTAEEDREGVAEQKVGYPVTDEET